MKSMHFRLLAAALAVLLGTAIAKSQTADTTAPSAPPAHRHMMGMHEPMMGFFARQLNLTDDQKTQMKAIMQKERPTIQPLHQQQHQIDMQLLQYVQGTFDQAKVSALAAQKAQVDAQLTVEETKIHNQMYQLLTPDQQAKAKELVAQHEARMQQHMQNNSEEPPAPPEQ